MAFSPQTGLVYIPAYALAYPFHQDPHFKQTPLRFNTGEDFPAMQRAIDGFERSLRLCAPTRLTAWDPVKRERVWRVEHGQLGSGIIKAWSRRGRIPEMFEDADADPAAAASRRTL
jgi:hypothetical protein